MQLSTFVPENKASEERHFYLNNSFIRLFDGKISNAKTNQTINEISRRHLCFESKLQNLSFCFNGSNTFQVCRDNLIECPWYFRCHSDKHKLIKIEKVCDFSADCPDQSDEKYCSDETHFNCTSGTTFSIDKSRVNDDLLDCSDRSDECKESQISSVRQMIKNDHLRKYIWVTLVGIVVFNSIVIRRNIKILKKIDKEQLIKYFNLVFVLNLSFSDIIYGFVLSAIAYSSQKFSGSYCASSFVWRSSLSCDIIGCLTVISSQTSLNILVLMTFFRLYTVYKPFKSLDTKKHRVYLLLLLCWVFSILLSIAPVVLKKEFTQKLVISKNIFFNNKKVDRVIEPNSLYKLTDAIENVWTKSHRKNKLPSKSFRETRNYKDWFLNSPDARRNHPWTSVDVKTSFGFYGSSSVCLPDFYSKSETASKFSVALMSLNSLLISFIVVGYALIFYKISSQTVDKRAKKKSEKENSVSVRIFLIMVTDVSCWLPIIVFSFASYFGYQINDVVHSLTSIVLLPINSLLNPVLYSRIDVVLFEKLKEVFINVKKNLGVRKNDMNK